MNKPKRPKTEWKETLNKREMIILMMYREMSDGLQFFLPFLLSKLLCSERDRNDSNR